MTETGTDDAVQVLQIQLPQSVTVSTFVAARIKEVEAMRKSIKQSTSVKMAFQKLPQHMRRRAMAHEVKRLPRRLREIHANQMKKSGLPPKSKRPSRKYRRRPYNLLNDYARRRRRVKWLNTHIWHAKRFFMVEKWGYKLPHHPCDKSFRACYRAATQHCLLQDISYNRVVEISGNYSFLVSKLNKLTASAVGLSFGAKCFSEGKKYGRVILFKPGNNDPIDRKPIGQVDFVWKNCSDIVASLWIFIHPAFYLELLNVFISLFELHVLNMEVDNDDVNKDSVYAGLEGVVLKELEFEISRLRLTGPLSVAVIQNAFKLVDFENVGNLPSWCNNYKIDTLSKQNQLFKDLSSDHILPPNVVFSVVVHDPRMNMPKKRTKSLPRSIKIDDIVSYHQNISFSPLWDSEVRQYVKENQVSNAQINEMRSELLVPGTDLNVPGEMIPVMLWRSGTKVGRCSSWDVIVPSSWAQHFFISFNMWGGRAGGLRETESLAFEESRGDILYPDSLAGEKEEWYQSDVVKQKFFSLPPNKRTNYIKFGMVSPLTFRWSLLVHEWCESDVLTGFFVLRDKKILHSVQEFLLNKSKTAEWIPIPENCLVAVQVLPNKKGQCSKFAEICLPIEADLKNEPVERYYKDPNMKKRNDMRRSHKLLLKRLMKRRKRAKKAGKPVIKTDTALLETYKTKMRNLWLPEPEIIRHSCTRQVMGFVKQGGFCYSIGKSKGLGYVVGASLNLLAKMGFRNKILFRNTNSRQYRLASIEVLMD
ncbi:POP1 ribonuclease P/MRP subunit [Rhynchophorus ferrugineus]|uniref:POP1 ribonuclease P/MRP subunit n=1 Tax=Rhynchophorus ferrugineus TaxID=354439 RepID=UPI003FCC3DD2